MDSPYGVIRLETEEKFGMYYLRIFKRKKILFSSQEQK